MDRQQYEEELKKLYKALENIPTEPVTRRGYTSYLNEAKKYGLDITIPAIKNLVTALFNAFSNSTDSQFANIVADTVLQNVYNTRQPLSGSSIFEMIKVLDDSYASVDIDYYKENIKPYVDHLEQANALRRFEKDNLVTTEEIENIIGITTSNKDSSSTKKEEPKEEQKKENLPQKEEPKKEQPKKKAKLSLEEELARINEEIRKSTIETNRQYDEAYKRRAERDRKREEERKHKQEERKRKQEEERKRREEEQRKRKEEELKKAEEYKKLTEGIELVVPSKEEINKIRSKKRSYKTQEDYDAIKAELYDILNNKIKITIPKVEGQDEFLQKAAEAGLDMDNPGVKNLMLYYHALGVRLNTTKIIDKLVADAKKMPTGAVIEKFQLLNGLLQGIPYTAGHKDETVSDLASLTNNIAMSLSTLERRLLNQKAIDEAKNKEIIAAPKATEEEKNEPIISVKDVVEAQKQDEEIDNRINILPENPQNAANDINNEDNQREFVRNYDLLISARKDIYHRLEEAKSILYSRGTKDKKGYAKIEEKYNALANNAQTPEELAEIRQQKMETLVKFCENDGTIYYRRLVKAMNDVISLLDEKNNHCTEEHFNKAMFDLEKRASEYGAYNGRNGNIKNSTHGTVRMQISNFFEKNAATFRMEYMYYARQLKRLRGPHSLAVYRQEADSIKENLGLDTVVLSKDEQDNFTEISACRSKLANTAAGEVPQVIKFFKLYDPNKSFAEYMDHPDGPKTTYEKAAWYASKTLFDVMFKEDITPERARLLLSKFNAEGFKQRIKALSKNPVFIDITSRLGNNALDKWDTVQNIKREILRSYDNGSINNERKESLKALAIGKRHTKPNIDRAYEFAARYFQKKITGIKANEFLLESVLFWDSEKSKDPKNAKKTRLGDLYNIALNYLKNNNVFNLNEGESEEDVIKRIFENENILKDITKQYLLQNPTKGPDRAQIDDNHLINPLPHNPLINVQENKITDIDSPTVNTENKAKNNIADQNLL